MSPEQLAVYAQQKMLRRKKQKKVPSSSKTLTAHTSPTQQRGQAYEQRAVNYLKQQGLIVLLQNLESRSGEIDIVARSTNYLIFVEVRQRTSRLYGGALYSVQRAKQQRIKRTAHYFLPMLCKRYFNDQLPFCRFDVMAIEGDTITWIPDAFQ